MKMISHFNFPDTVVGELTVHTVHEIQITNLKIFSALDGVHTKDRVELRGTSVPTVEDPADCATSTRSRASPSYFVCVGYSL